MECTVSAMSANSNPRGMVSIWTSLTTSVGWINPVVSGSSKLKASSICSMVEGMRSSSAQNLAAWRQSPRAWIRWQTPSTAVLNGTRPDTWASLWCSFSCRSMSAKASFTNSSSRVTLNPRESTSRMSPGQAPSWAYTNLGKVLHFSRFTKPSSWTREKSSLALSMPTCKSILWQNSQKTSNHSPLNWSTLADPPASLSLCSARITLLSMWGICHLWTCPPSSLGSLLYLRPKHMRVDRSQWAAMEFSPAFTIFVDPNVVGSTFIPLFPPPVARSLRVRVNLICSKGLPASSGCSTLWARSPQICTD
mmetsp:Transcript_55998/g.122697  ORF Transcript_55998/g.122697 Transcript_55998/m.122697 type:complete len:307 (+) Transcript_55998:519-1439(+)